MSPAVLLTKGCDSAWCSMLEMGSFEREDAVFDLAGLPPVAKSLVLEYAGGARFGGLLTLLEDAFLSPSTFALVDLPM